MNNIARTSTLLLLVLTIGACGSLKPFHEYARAGDTIAIPVGKQIDFKRDNISVTFTPSGGSPVMLSANDPAVRAVINFYPDPLASMLVSKDINEQLTPLATTYFDTTHYSAGSESDWFQTVVFVDVPTSMPTGTTQIEVSNTLATTHTSTLEIIDGIGTPNSFTSDLFAQSLDKNMLNGLSRVNHTIIDIDSTTIPSAIELTFTHDPDVSVGGTGKYTVVNPTGNKKNMHWSDDGSNLKVILLETYAGSISTVYDYKFYIAGTANNLQLSSINGYDATGTLISGVTANLSQH